MKILFFAFSFDLLVDSDTKTITSFSANEYNPMKVATDNHAEAIVNVSHEDLNQIELVAVNSGYKLVILPHIDTPEEPEDEPEDDSEAK